jgi:eukaryotic-like serine/threonine-protein kinase
MKYGRYETSRELGRGSMGVVYEAHDPQIDRTLALKVLRQDRHASDAFVKRFLKEAKAIGRLSHPNIVTVYDAGEDQGTIYIAMEFLEGVPLNQLIEEKKFSYEEVLDLGVQIAETLDYAHSKRVVHRDIKPSNILVQPKGRVKITDFGIAHIEDPSATLQTQDGEILGTPAYMSPEQVLGKSVDGRSDLFSLGVILYELSTGTRPFGRQGKTLATLFNEITHGPPPEPVQLNRDIDPRLSQVIMKCLAKEPQDRYATGEALADALRQCRKREPVVARAEEAEPSTEDSEKLVPKPTLLRMALFAFLFLVGLAASIVYLYPGAIQVATDWLGKPEGTGQPPAKTAVLKADSVPSGVDLWIDGTVKGKTPLEIELNPGKHTVKTVAPGYDDWSGEISLDESKPQPLKIELKRKAALASVNIESTPTDAEVYVNGDSEGKTPLRLELPLGEHLVEMALKDHEDWKSRIQLNEAREYPVKAELKPVRAAEAATLKIETDPGGASVFVNGERKGASPSDISLPVGTYQISTKLDGYMDWSEEMELSELKSYPLMIRLQPAVKNATLRVVSTPSGAEVQVEGKLLGRTPVSTTLPTGTRTVRISMPGFQDRFEKVQMDEPREYAVEATLERILKQAVLKVESTPAGAEVFIDGTSKGNTPLELNIQPGDPIVSVEHPNYERWQDKVHVAEGRDVPIRITLKPVSKESFLALSSDPSKARVFLDGVEKGNTPLKLKLPAGNYNVQMKLKNYKDWETQVQLAEAQEYPLKASLSKATATSRQTPTPGAETRQPTSTRTRPPASQPSDDWGIGTYRDQRINQR